MPMKDPQAQMTQRLLKKSVTIMTEFWNTLGIMACLLGFLCTVPTWGESILGEFMLAPLSVFLMLGGGGALALKTKINWIELIWLN